jgi:hypothetical protein
MKLLNFYVYKKVSLDSSEEILRGFGIFTFVVIQSDSFFSFILTFTNIIIEQLHFSQMIMLCIVDLCI